VEVPLFLAMAVLFAVGACVGSMVNLGVATLAWDRSMIHPWLRPAPQAPRRHWSDRVPLIGWLGMRRESAFHGRGFWVRPMLVELLLGTGFAALYWWEIDRCGLLPFESFPGPLPAAILHVLAVQFFSHMVLIGLMLLASLIDADEKIIPDTVTVPGTLLGLAIAAACPWSLLPIPSNVGKFVAGLPIGPLLLTSPDTPVAWLWGWPYGGSLLLGLGCWWLWCVALMPRRWYARHGWRRAMELLLARLARDAAVKLILTMGLLGTVAIAALWFVGGIHWLGFLTALVGMTASGFLVWMVRIIGHAVLKREAMGFGDVTLMAMLGAFLGWQACLLVFFLAPFAGLVLGGVVLTLRRDSVIPYGPFLCLGALVLLTFWASFWRSVAAFFAMGPLVPVILLVCMALMAVLLAIVQMLKALFR
jgi:prepilin signal peptidase PulO-like enzyme (type II secretory pathway)